MSNIIYEKAVALWGWFPQIMKWFEESSELSKEICKYFNSSEKGFNIIKIQGEIADVQIMLNQLKFMFDEKECEKVFNLKLLKLESKIKNYIKKS